MILTAIDIETTGLDPDTHGLLQFAAAIYDTEDKSKNWADPEVVDSVPHVNFHVFDHEKPLVWSQHSGQEEPYFAKSDIFKEYDDAFGAGCTINDEMEKEESELIWCEFRHACPQRLLMPLFYKFLKHNNITRATALGKNFFGFDLRFLRRQPHFDPTRLHHRAADPSMFYFDGKDERLPSLDTCLTRAKVDRKVSHDALEDVRETILAFDIGHKKLKSDPVEVEYSQYDDD